MKRSFRAAFGLAAGCWMAAGGAWAQAPAAAPQSPPPQGEPKPEGEPKPPAQAEEQPTPSAAPPEQTAPARAYPPPPPQPVPWPYGETGVQRGDGMYGTDRDLLIRPFSFTAAVGPGGFFGPGEEAFAVSYTLFRLGFGLAPGLSFVLGYEGVGTGSENPATGLDSWLSQNIWSLGIQGHVMQHLYVRGTVGVGHVEEETDIDTFSGGSGVSLGAAVGAELLQSNHVALGVEGAASTTHYSRERWHTLGLHLTLSFY